MYQNTPFYDIRPIRDFRDMLAQSAERFADRPAFKLKTMQANITMFPILIFRPMYMRWAPD